MSDFTREWIAKQRHLSNCARDSSLALDSLEAVLELHQPDGEGMCRSCDYGSAHPCPTVRAVEAALRGES